MRNITLLFAISFISIACNAQPLLTKGDNSFFTDLCVKAVVQPDLARDLMRQARIEDKGSIVCNGRSLTDFVRSYKPTAKQKTFIASSDSSTTALCIAAVTSKEAFRTAIDEYQIEQRQLSNLQCNGLPVSGFAKRYGGIKLSI